MNPANRPLVPFLLGCLLLAAGCDGIIPPPQADPTRYYVLSGQALPASPAAAVPAGRLRIGLRTVELASYLRTRSMIVRRGPNELALDEYHRWAEPLGDGIARVLRARLLANPAVGSAAMQPFAFDADRDYDVTVTVLHCEGSLPPDGRGVAYFEALVEIATPGPNPRIVARRVFSAPQESWNGSDFDRLAGLLSEDAGLLGQEIGTALTSAPPPPAPAP